MRGTFVFVLVINALPITRECAPVYLFTEKRLEKEGGHNPD